MAAVWPGMVLPRRWRSSAVVRVLSRRAKKREKNVMTHLRFCPHSGGDCPCVSKASILRFGAIFLLLAARKYRQRFLEDHLMAASQPARRCPCSAANGGTDRSTTAPPMAPPRLVLAR